MTPGRSITLGFLFLIVMGALLLCLPVSHRGGAEVSIVDALFTSTSAVCVTGLVAFDTGATFSVFGRTVIAVLIQMGGLGITTFGLGVLLFSRKKAGMRGMLIAKESFNHSTLSGVMELVKTVLIFSVSFELAGALLCYPVFCGRYGPVRSIGYSLFHSVAAFNNAGFDIFGTGDSMYAYIDHAYLNIVTAMLVMFGGLGFFVMSDILQKKTPRRFTLHTKIVVSMTLILTVAGTILLKITETEKISWLSAFFTSVSTRTAGFATKPMSEFSNAGILVMNVLMMIGASPGSTGGGIKTTTAFVLIVYLLSYATNSQPAAFRRKLSEEVIKKSLAILMLCVCVVFLCTALLCLLEPEIPMRDILFEVCSGFGTAGLSTGITGGLCDASKLILICTMFVGRLGPLTIATLWISRKDTGISRAEESIQVG